MERGVRKKAPLSVYMDFIHGLTLVNVLSHTNANVNSIFWSFPHINIHFMAKTLTETKKSLEY